MKLLLQYLIPHQLFNCFSGFLANIRIKWVKNRLIAYFVNRYPVDMSEAIEEDPFAYGSYNDFFIRQLKPHLRPLDLKDTSVISPVDGALSFAGDINHHTLIQAKGKEYTLTALLGSDDWAQYFTNGSFATLYLAPPDYHRVHMPIDGSLQAMRHVPGKLFSVSEFTTERIDQLFAKNERVINLFDTSVGKLAVIMVGAMIVGSISTSWAGQVKTHRGKNVTTVDYQQPITLNKGDELGYFKLGSTVILLFEQGKIALSAFEQGQVLRMGQKIAGIN